LIKETALSGLVLIVGATLYMAVTRKEFRDEWELGIIIMLVVGSLIIWAFGLYRVKSLFKNLPPKELILVLVK
jgi:hypothetical protein